MPVRKLTIVKNPHTRALIAWGLLAAAFAAIMLLIPGGVGVFVLSGVGIIILGIFTLLMLISTVFSVVHWAQTGDLYSPWAMSPWGRGPQGGRHGG